MRLDLKVVECGLVKSREKAKNLIESGFVYVNGKQIKKASFEINDEKIEIIGEENPFVNRGGLKLEKTINHYKIDLKDKTVMDVGASTGGFTDCMLQHGAKLVYAVDVGHDQLDEKLKNDTRVVNLENTNIRYITKEQIPNLIDFCSVDVSFISLTLVIPVIADFLRDEGEMVCLIKPQFEAGRENIGKNGIIRDKTVHIMVLKKICQFSLNCGFNILGLINSPIKGKDGNTEFLIYVRKTSELQNNSNNVDFLIKNI